ncbi:MAG: Mut7-C RNAse domain-containing protein, partial [Myxococcota bacterium]
MLGRLARWLRLLGFDCAWEHDIADEVLIRRATAEGRIVLSRDRALTEEWRISGIHWVDAEKVREQLAEVVRAFDLAPDIRLLSRCSHCNAPLAPAALGDVVDRVPPRGLERHDVFSACPACMRVYWEGTHTARIKRFVDEPLARLSKRSSHPLSPGPQAAAWAGVYISRTPVRGRPERDR